MNNPNSERVPLFGAKNARAELPNGGSCLDGEIGDNDLNFEKTRNDLENSVPEALISFHDVSFSVKTGPPCKRKVKMILNNVSGVFHPGLNAIMGPSGAGKTTLLDLLAQRNNTELLQGRVLLNGRSLPKNFNFLAGYVAQDDVISWALTVEENLQFAANMKMRNCGKEQRVARVHQLIQELSLEKCRNTRVGNAQFKGVSGGEKKRCCVGMELVTKPPVIFLDEPTTGLDSTTSFSVIKLLQHISSTEKTIFIFSIHQPKFGIYRLFDRLHLLSLNGQTVYHGLASNAQKYFEDLGFICEDYCNPAEFFLDVIIECDNRGQNTELEAARNYGSVDGSSELLLETSHRRETKDLPDCFERSGLRSELDEKLTNVINSKNELEFDESLSFARNWFVQVRYLTKRNFRNLIYFLPAIIAPCLLSLFIAGLLAFLLYDWDYDVKGYQNIYGILFFVVLQIVVQNVPCVRSMTASQEVFITESKNGYYKVSAYLVGKVFGEILPMRTAPVTVLVLSVYLFLRLKTDLLSFAIFFLASQAANLAAIGVTIFVAVIVNDFGRAVTLIPLITLIMIFFSGFFTNIDTLPDYLEFIKYLSIIWYGLSVLAATQFRDASFCGFRRLLANESATEVNWYLCETGEELMTRSGIGYEARDVWIDFAGLFGFCVVFYPLTYVFLRRIAKASK